MSDERLGPDFIGVGMQKCGTSWLADIVAQHPDILMHKKEINFFVRHFHKGYHWYHNWFQERGDRKAGEFTQSYMISPRPDPTRREFYPNWNPRRMLMFWRRLPSAREEIAKHYPWAKVLAIFRDPADRAWSAYWYWRNRKERLKKKVVPFDKMWKDDGRWIRTRGMYATYLAEWKSTFPDMGVFFYDDISSDPAALARQVYRFIGIDDTFEPKTAQVVNKGSYESMPAKTRGMLIDYYRDEIFRLQDMTGRDLTSWLV